MTNREIVAGCNELARIFYRMHGCDVAAGFRFDRADHPQEQSMWYLAAAAYDYIADIDVENALELLDE